MPVVPDAAPDLTHPDPVPPYAPGADVPTAWGAPGAAMLTGDLVPGAPVLGGPTVDSDLDGVPDTAVAEVADQLVLATDLDHDGRADAVTRIGADGVVTARAVPGPEHPDRPDHRWDAPPPPPPSVDPRTGAWVRG